MKDDLFTTISRGFKYIVPIHHDTIMTGHSLKEEMKMDNKDMNKKVFGVLAHLRNSIKTSLR